VLITNGKLGGSYLSTMEIIMRNKFAAVLLACLWSLGLAQCGGKESLSKNVDITFVPQNPIVVNADLTLYPGQLNETEVKAPWFLFKTRVENNSTRKLYLVTYGFDVTGIKTGVPSTVHKSIDPSVTCDVTGATRAYLAILEPGQVYQAVTDGCDPTSIRSDTFEGWYIDSLPDSDSFFYGVDVTGEGWFVDGNEIPVERLVFYGSISTQ
jgi:hypothetical protein